MGEAPYLRTPSVRSHRKFCLAMQAPAIILYFSVITIPVIFSLGLSFTDFNVYKFSAVWQGIANFIEIFTDPQFWIAFRNTFYVVLVSIFGQIPLGLLLAYIIFQKTIRGGNVLQVLVFLPMLIPSVVVGILWNRILIDPNNGVLIVLMRFISGNSQFMMPPPSQYTAILPIGVAMIWMYTGFYMLIFLSNMQKIDTAIFESARMDGASEFIIFGKIVIPSLSPAIITNIMLSIAGSLKGFDLIYTMTGGGPGGFTEVLSIYMYRVAFSGNRDYDMGSAIASIMILISIVLIMLSNLINTKIEKKG